MERKQGCICELDEKGNPLVANYAECPVHKPDAPDPKKFAQDYIKMFEPNSNWEDFDETGKRIEHEKLCAIKLVDEILLILTSSNMKPFTATWVIFYESVKEEINRYGNNGI